MNWPIILVLFFILSLIGSILLTVLKVWLSKKFGTAIKSTQKDSSYVKPFE
jgi:hypothetical protein